MFSGDITLKVLESVDTKVDLKGDDVCLDDQLHVEGTKESRTVTGEHTSTYLRYCTKEYKNHTVQQPCILVK